MMLVSARGFACSSRAHSAREKTCLLDSQVRTFFLEFLFLKLRLSGSLSKADEYFFDVSVTVAWCHALRRKLPILKRRILLESCMFQDTQCPKIISSAKS